MLALWWALPRFSTYLYLFQKRISKSFHLICGTGIGGVIALSLSKGLSLDVIEEGLNRLGDALRENKKGFVSSWWSGSLYDHKALTSCFPELANYELDREKMQPQPPHTFVVTEHHGRPYLLRNYAALTNTYSNVSKSPLVERLGTTGLLALQAAIATCAEPGYFRPIAAEPYKWSQLGQL